MEEPDLWPVQPITWISVKDISVSLKFLSLDLQLIETGANTENVLPLATRNIHC